MIKEKSQGEETNLPYRRISKNVFPPRAQRLLSFPRPLPELDALTDLPQRGEYEKGGK